MSKLNNLWAQFQEGKLDREAFFESLLAILKGLLKNQDLAHETAVKVFLGMDKFQGRSAFGTWVWTIARNNRADMHRTPSGVEFVEFEEARDVAVPLEDTYMEDVTFDNPQDQALWNMKYQGFTDQEIATTLGIPLNTAKSHWLRLKEKLKCS